MKCPKCSTGRMHDTQLVALSSAFHGSDSEVPLGESGGWSCYACGYYKPYPVTPKPIPAKSQATINQQERMAEYVDRLANGEPTQQAIVRCNDFFDKHREHIKDQLIRGLTFHAIHTGLKKDHESCPSRSWLRETYFAWIKETTI